MLIGIISDSHDHIDNIKKAVEVFKNKKTDFVVHLGDYVNMLAIEAFDGLNLIGIFGNNDGDKVRIINAFDKIKGGIKGDFFEFEKDGLKFAAYHGTEPELRDALIYCDKYDVVLFGHNHKLESKKAGKTQAINPGTAHGFGGRATIAIFNTQNKEVEFINL